MEDKQFNEIRPCEYLYGGTYHPALFHGWTTINKPHRYFNEGDLVALVEDEGGRMEVISPSAIRFMNFKEQMERFGDNKTKQCEHKWVFQETQKKTTTTNNNGDYTAHYHRVDVYYCEYCCEIKKIEQKESVSLPFGGIRNPDRFAPFWY